MKLIESLQNKLLNLTKSKLLAKFDPSVLVLVETDIEEKLNLKHKGFYLGLIKPNGDILHQTGFLQDGQTNILESSIKAIDAMYIELQAQGISGKSIPTASFSITVVWDVIFDNNGLAWNENEDGIYFSWGDRYTGMYLPYEIKAMNISKVEIMNRLCSYKTGTASNLWRLPEGMCSRLICDSYILK